MLTLFVADNDLSECVPDGLHWIGRAPYMSTVEPLHQWCHLLKLYPDTRNADWGMRVWRRRGERYNNDCIGGEEEV